MKRSSIVFILVFSMVNAMFPLMNSGQKAAIDGSTELDANYFALSPSTPFLQDWTNIGLITANDDWSGVPSIVGHHGNDLTTTIGADPQTVLGDGGATTVDVIANQTNPATQTSGGVAEFEITNPVGALQGSGTADAPFIDIRLNTTACAAPANTLNVAYKVRDVDAAADDAVQAIALQFRAGTTGDYTNVPAAFIADATTGGTATQETNTSVPLPATAQGQANVHVRVMTINAFGSDEWVGIDDINISCAASGGNPGTFAMAGNLADTPETATSASFAVNRTVGTTGSVTVNYTFGGTATGGTGASCGGADYDNSTTSVIFNDGETSKNITIPLCDDAADEPNETVTVTLQSATNGGTIGSPATAAVTILDNDVAAPASIGGRVTDASGRGVGKAKIVITTSSSTLPEGGSSVVAIIYTSSFGYYTINALPTGVSYTVTVAAKGNSFSPNSQTFILNSDNFGVNFQAQP